MAEIEFVFPYQGKICPIANETCPYKLYCTECDLHNSYERVKKISREEVNRKQFQTNTCIETEKQIKIAIVV